MSEVILKEYSNGTKLCFTAGKFDNYQVIINGKAILDEELLRFFEIYKIHHNSPELVWKLIIQVSNQITKDTTDLSNFQTPTLNSQKLEEQPLSATILLDAYAACLIAEEQKKWTKLGKRIKLLAAYQVLFEDYTPEQASKFSTGKEWQGLDKLCTARGF